MSKKYDGIGNPWIWLENYPQPVYFNSVLFT